MPKLDPYLPGAGTSRREYPPTLLVHCTVGFTDVPYQLSVNMQAVRRFKVAARKTGDGDRRRAHGLSAGGQEGQRRGQRQVRLAYIKEKLKS